MTGMDEMLSLMQRALVKAAEAENEVPVGALIVKDGEVIAEARNERETGGPSDHAEMLAIARAAEKLGTRHLHGCSLYVTLEPCPMCAGAAVMAELDRVVFGAWDEKQGCCGSVYCLPQDPAFYHRAEVIGGVMEKECAALIRSFFARKRNL